MNAAQAENFCKVIEGIDKVAFCTVMKFTDGTDEVSFEIEVRIAKNTPAIKKGEN